MRQELVDILMVQYRDKIPEDEVQYLQNQLLLATDEVFYIMASIKTKNPITTLLFSIALGCLGVDRFYIGDIFLGILKLLVGLASTVTTPAIIIWWIIDCFSLYKKAKKKNLDNILEAVQPYIYAQPQKKNGW